ncbi:hypothetical protein DVA67_016430 [Solirubrobacter sp. CPCC 204708]|uniref:Uncharacterized protein n=1 Tax=Solirubrobacter deserti TaxID=2282478 RepID=A0ABT4RSQ1_9ACTN|nr:hypothetical protein [Solirubrobacter deserti]MBE2317571.1 hypothetical protein [Solirubrobacter deserti]MDA0141265.1 hypothetical protein [Solirubrobacter deserti]
MRVIAATILALLLFAPAATAKEGVRARLESRLDLNARAGSEITVKWRLYIRDSGRPFDAGELFVRLRSKGSGAPTRAYGKGDRGRYTARVRVPRGGLGGIRFGLMGYRSFPGGESEPAPVFFPLDNDPF